MITKDILNELLNYDKESGEFTWKVRVEGMFKHKSNLSAWNTRYAGKTAGSVSGTGYVEMRILGSSQKAHRLAMIMTFGCAPEFVDHINNNRSDNRIVNLREATRSENCRNSVKNSNNTSGVKGVSLLKRTGKWAARIRFCKKLYFLGYFSEIKDAEDAVRKKRAELHGDFANDG